MCARLCCVNSNALSGHLKTTRALLFFRTIPSGRSLKLSLKLNPHLALTLTLNPNPEPQPQPPSLTSPLTLSVLVITRLKQSKRHGIEKEIHFLVLMRPSSLSNFVENFASTHFFIRDFLQET